MISSEILAYWWRPSGGGGNAGDEVTPFLLREYFGVEYKYSPISACNLLSTGSILGWLSNSQGLSQCNSDVHVIGSGFMDPSQAVGSLSDNVKVNSVRGHLSRLLLPKKLHKSVSVGDPGLLVAKVYGEISDRNPNYKFGVIPHITFRGRESFCKAYRDLPGVKFIDIATTDILGLLKDMLDCEVIISQSLHGLIFADSLGVPNVWVEHGALGRSKGDFKFYDYFSSIGRPFNKKIEVVRPLSEGCIYESMYNPDMGCIGEVINDVEESFKKGLGLAEKSNREEAKVQGKDLGQGKELIAKGEFVASVSIKINLLCSDGVVDGGALLSFSFEGEDGEVDSLILGDLLGVSSSKNKNVGLFKYLPLVPGEEVYEVSLNVPRGVVLKKIYLMKWKSKKSEIRLVGGVVSSH